jgi:hypothetical protein
MLTPGAPAGRRNQLLTDFRHDLRSPLSGLVGITSLLIEQLPPDEADQQHMYRLMVDRCSAELVRMVVVATDYVDIVSGGKLRTRLESTNLALKEDVFDDVIKACQSAATSMEIELEVDVALDLHVRSPRAPLTYVLVTLLLRAIQAVPSGKSLRVQAHMQEELNHTQVLHIRFTHSLPPPPSTTPQPTSTLGGGLVSEGDGDSGCDTPAAATPLELSRDADVFSFMVYAYTEQLWDGATLALNEPSSDADNRTVLARLTLPVQ